LNITDSDSKSLFRSLSEINNITDYLSRDTFYHLNEIITSNDEIEFVKIYNRILYENLIIVDNIIKLYDGKNYSDPRFLHLTSVQPLILNANLINPKINNITSIIK
jgi:hypothetical protein